jgi:geranylgeranylglycerol-phosphate geranylgeranyltransferase
VIARPAEVARFLRSAIVLARPLNCLIASVSVAIGAFLAGHTVSLRSGLAAAMTFLVCAGAYVINDYFDVAADRLTKPRRPIAAGLMPRALALAYAAALWVGAAVLALLAGRAALVCFAGWACGLWLYSSRLKARGVWGHLVVSLIASSGFMLGAASEGRVLAGTIPAGIATVFHLARETAKSAADAAGDGAVGVPTLAVRIGEDATLKLTLWLIVMAAAASLAPAVLRTYGFLYLGVVLAAVFPLLAICTYRIAVARREGTCLAAAASSVAAMLKLAMVAGLVALFLAGV